MADCVAATVDCVMQHSGDSGTLYYLSLLFGSWVRTVFGGGGTGGADATLTPLMIAIGSLNFIAFIFGAILTAYNASTISLNAAAMGVVFHKTSAFLPIRVGTALISLAPVIFGGHGIYVSIAQVSAMQIVVAGAGAADWTWRLTVGSFIEDMVERRTIPIQKSYAASMIGLTEAFFCAAHVSAINDSVKRYQISDTIIDGGAYIVREFNTPPSVGDLSHGGDFNVFDGEGRRTFSFAEGSCGSFEYSILPNPEIGLTTDLIGRVAYNANRLGLNALEAFIKEMDAAATLHLETFGRNSGITVRTYLDSVKAYEKSAEAKSLLHGMHDPITQHLVKAAALALACSQQAAAAAFGIAPDARMGDGCGSAADYGDAQEVGSQLATDLSDGGWLYMFSGFNRLTGAYAIANSQASFVEKLKLTTTSFPEKATFCPEMGWWDRLWSGGDDGGGASQVTSTAVSSLTSDQVDSISECSIYHFIRSGDKSVNLTEFFIGRYLQRNPGEIVAGVSGRDIEEQLRVGAPLADSGVSESGAIWVATFILNRVMELGSDNSNTALSTDNPIDSGMDGLDAFSLDPTTSGIGQLAVLGEGLKQIYMTTILIQSALEAGYDTLSNNTFLGPPGIIKSTAMAFVLKLLAPLVMSSMAGAFILGNVLPMLPVIIGVFVVAGYFVTVAEGLGGVALGSALLASANGDGLLSVHGMRMASLLSALFLKPVLHVVGFVLSFALTSVSYHYLKNVWFSVGNAGGFSAWDIFDLVMLTGGLPIVAFFLMTYCLKAINLYVTNILQWVATNAVGAFGDTSEYINSTRGAFGGIKGAFDASLKPKQNENDGGGGAGGGGKKRGSKGQGAAGYASGDANAPQPTGKS